MLSTIQQSYCDNLSTGLPIQLTRESIISRDLERLADCHQEDVDQAELTLGLVDVIHSKYTILLQVYL